MNRLYRLNYFIVSNFRSTRVLTLNRLAAFLHTSFEPPPHEFLTIRRILPDKVLVPIMRTIYSTDNLNDLRSFISQLSPDFRRKHHQLVFFWSDVNTKSLINLNLSILKPFHIHNLQKYASNQLFKYATSDIIYIQRLIDNYNTQLCLGNNCF